MGCNMVYLTEYWNQDDEDDEFNDDVSFLDLEEQLEVFLEKESQDE